MPCFHQKHSFHWLLFSWIISKLDMNFDMFCKISLFFVSLAALVALEWSLPRVLPHVLLQITRSSASIVALLTFERFLSCVHPHNVNFQITSCDTRILAWCASVWLFTRVRLLVRLQGTWLCCFMFTLIAIIQIFPSVFLDVPFEAGWIIKRIVACIDCIREVFPQCASWYAIWGCETGCMKSRTVCTGKVSLRCEWGSASSI